MSDWWSQFVERCQGAGGKPPEMELDWRQGAVTFLGVAISLLAISLLAKDVMAHPHPATASQQTSSAPSCEFSGSFPFSAYAPERHIHRTCVVAVYYIERLHLPRMCSFGRGGA